MDAEGAKISSKSMAGGLQWTSMTNRDQEIGKIFFESRAMSRLWRQFCASFAQPSANGKGASQQRLARDDWRVFRAGIDIGLADLDDCAPSCGRFRRAQPIFLIDW